MGIRNVLNREVLMHVNGTEPIHAFFMGLTPNIGYYLTVIISQSLYFSFIWLPTFDNLHWGLFMYSVTIFLRVPIFAAFCLFFPFNTISSFHCYAFFLSYCIHVLLMKLYLYQPFFQFYKMHDTCLFFILQNKQQFIILLQK